uniref:Uncharacterized protein n=1 Tax=Anopheles coluzzii TaxID=1518534 RepID=A0A8W7PLG1_ANOCL
MIFEESGAKAISHFLRQHDSAKGNHKTGTQQGCHRNSDYPGIHDVSEQPPINRFLLRSHGMMRMLTAIDCRWPCPESGDFGDTLVLLRRSKYVPRWKRPLPWYDCNSSM